MIVITEYKTNIIKLSKSVFIPLINIEMTIEINIKERCNKIGFDKIFLYP